MQGHGLQASRRGAGGGFRLPKIAPPFGQAEMLVKSKTQQKIVTSVIPA